MKNSTVLALMATMLLVTAAPSASSHGRPEMVWKIKSISAKAMQIFGPNEDAYANGINNQGSMVGSATVASGKRHAFKRDLLGATTDIGAYAPQQHTEAHDINETSEVVGSRTTASGSRAFYWSPNEGFVNLSSSNPEGISGSYDYHAFGINNAGRIVGAGDTSTGAYDSAAVTWWHRHADPEQVIDIPPGWGNWAHDLTDNGWVAGEEFNLYNYDTYGFRFRDGTLIYPPDPSPGRKAEAVYGVNEAGIVVGDAWWECCGSRAVLWRPNGSFLVMGVLPGGDHATAADINEQEFAVGWSATAVNSNDQRAFLFHLEFGGMIALPVPEGFPDTGATKCGASALNDRKSNGLIQVAGYCTLNGKPKVVRWDVFVEEVLAH